jgi:hypothetical protein
LSFFNLSQPYYYYYYYYYCYSTVLHNRMGLRRPPSLQSG